NLIYDYKLVAFDFCGDTISTSNISRNIHLTAAANTQDLEIAVNWNEYLNWDGQVQEYEVYRRTSYEDPYTYMHTLAPWVTSFTDDVSEQLAEEGLFCYKIVAIEAPNTFNNSRQSTSNEACASQDPLMWIPNTFVINGFNDIFKPVAGFI